MSDDALPGGMGMSWLPMYWKVSVYKMVAGWECTLVDMGLEENYSGMNVAMSSVMNYGRKKTWNIILIVMMYLLIFGGSSTSTLLIFCNFCMNFHGSK